MAVLNEIKFAIRLLLKLISNIQKVCSSETTGVASGSVTSASASIRFHRRRRNNQTAGCTRRSMSGAASNASDIASSVDLNEYRSSKLSRKRSSRSVVPSDNVNHMKSVVLNTNASNQSFFNNGPSYQSAKILNSNNKGFDNKMSIQKINSSAVVSSDMNNKVKFEDIF